jgi:hypothetical protein
MARTAGARFRAKMPRLVEVRLPPSLLINSSVVRDASLDYSLILSLSIGSIAGTPLCCQQRTGP